MTVKQQWMLVAAIVVTLAGGLIAATRFLGDEIFPVTVGAAAPDFSAVTIDESPMVRTMADYKGEVVMLNIWATWCLPCRVEMPSMQYLHAEYAPRGLKVVAVSIDDPGQEQHIRDFVKEFGLTFEILHDAPGAIRRQFQTTGVPETFIIGKDGTIRKKVIGASDWNSAANRALIAQLLSE